MELQVSSGSSGTSGSSGSSGTSGSSGSSGTSGSSGSSGSSGTSGSSGSSGSSGTSGTSGSSGSSGTSGIVGDEFEYDDPKSSDTFVVNNGDYRFNNLDASLATTLALYVNDANGKSIADIRNAFVAAQNRGVVIVKQNGSSITEFNVTLTNVSGSRYTFTISYVTGPTDLDNEDTKDIYLGCGF